MKKYIPNLYLLLGFSIYYITTSILISYIHLLHRNNVFKLLKNIVVNTVTFNSTFDLIESFFSNFSLSLSTKITTSLAVFVRSDWFMWYFLISSIFLLVFYIYHNPSKNKKKKVVEDNEEQKSDFILKSELNKLKGKNILNFDSFNGLILGSLTFVEKKILNTIKKQKNILISSKSKLNKHVLVLGGPSSGKSINFIKPNIINASKNNSSIILTSTKKDLYEDTSKYLLSKNYDVKLLNLGDLNNTSYWNPIEEVNSEISALYLANIIIDNFKTEYTSVKETQLYLLKALILYTKNYLSKDEQNLNSIYLLLKKCSVKKLDSIFSKIPEHKSAKIAYEIFKRSEEDKKDKVIKELLSRLHIFANPKIKKFTSKSDFRLSDAKKKKCAYFCILSDSHESYNLISNVFFSLLFLNLSEQNYMNEKDEKEVLLLLDDFGNIGKIPDFNKHLATSRKRKINCSVILQNIKQIYDLYPKTYDEILGNFDNTVFFGSNDKNTLEYFSNLIGNQIYGDKAKLIISPEELKKMDINKNITYLRGQKPIVLNKTDISTFEDYSDIKSMYNPISSFKRDSKVNEHISIEENKSLDQITSNKLEKVKDHQLFKQMKTLRYLLPENLIESPSISNTTIVNKQLSNLVNKINKNSTN